jgi:hypothetical protein
MTTHRIGRRSLDISVAQSCRVRIPPAIIEGSLLILGIDYFTKVLEDDLKAIVKPQYVDQLPRAIKGPVKTVKPLIEAKSELGNMKHIMDVLGECCVRGLAT